MTFINQDRIPLNRPGATQSANHVHLQPGDHFAPVNGVNLHYFVAGQGPLLFVVPPGWGVGSIYLQRGFEPLERYFKLVFIDPRGSGKSSRPTDLTQMGSANMTDDLNGLRQYIGLESLNLLGHSNGGAIALSYAER